MPYPYTLHPTQPLNNQNYLEGSIIRNIRSSSFSNNSGLTTQVQTITPDVSDDGATLFVLRELTTGQTVTFQSAASPTAAAVVTGLRAALANNPVLNGLAIFSGTTALIATNRQAGASANTFNFVDGGSTPVNTLSVANTVTPSNGSFISPGRGLVIGANGIVGLPTSSTFTFAGLLGLNFTDNPSYNYPGSPEGLFNAPLNPGVRVQDGEVACRVLTPVNPTTVLAMVHTGANAGLICATGFANSSNIPVRSLDVGGVGDIVRIAVNIA